MKSIKPARGWGIATQDGNNRFGLVYAVQSTRKELREKYPWTHNRDGYKYVRVKIIVDRSKP